MSKLIIKTLILFLVLINYSYSQKLNSIIVEGNERISDETIVVFSGLKIDDEINEKELNEVYIDLYNTNFFKEIELNLSNDGVLQIVVLENPIIQSITFDGIKNKSLIESLRKILLNKERAAFTEKQTEKDLINILNGLRSSGYYFAEVQYEVNKNQNNTVDLIYNIDQGKKAYIKKIKFIGDKFYKDRKLRSIITSEENKFWKFISSKKFIDKKRIELDTRLLKSYYLNQGFYDVKINSTHINLLDDESFELTFDINSGNVFYFNDFSLILPPDYETSNFDSLNKIFASFKGKKYSINKIEEITEEIDRISLEEQFEFTSSTFTEKILDNNKIDFAFKIQETKKTYIERINIFGNSITNEATIRNKFIIDEGDPYNEILKNKTVNNIKSANIFDNVVAKVEDGSSENYKIINIEVVEKATGEISIGAGYGTQGGSIGFSIRENNFLGQGINIINEFSIKGDSFTGTFRHNNPHYKNSNRALNTTVSLTRNDKLTTSGFENKILNTGIGTFFEQYKDLSVSPNLDFSYEKLTTNSNASSFYKKQKGDYTDLSFNYGVSFDKRDNKFRPQEGFRTVFNQDIPIYSDNPSVANTFNYVKYFSFNENILNSIDFYAKAINSITDDDVRVSKRIFLPSRRLRGFESGKVGPKDGDEHIGGNYATSVNFITQFPKFLPELQNTDLNFFVDAANLWGVDYDDTIKDASKIRSSVGLAIDWFTPIGPLNFSFSQPITKLNTDVKETFRFNIGTSF